MMNTTSILYVTATGDVEIPEPAVGSGLSQKPEPRNEGVQPDPYVW